MKVTNGWIMRHAIVYEYYTSPLLWCRVNIHHTAFDITHGNRKGHATYFRREVSHALSDKGWEKWDINIEFPVFP